MTCAKAVSLVLGLVLSGVIVAACSGSSGGASCSSPDPCPKDPPLTAQDVSQCQQLESQCSGFAAYYACAFSQIKCTSAGTLDEQATQQAIVANCQSQAQAVRGCQFASSGFDGGGGFDSGAACGFSGEACCTTGTPCQDGCCDTTGHCVATGEQCSGGTAVCTNGSCQPCGAPGQACCPADACTGGCCDTSSGTGTCVASGSSCTSIGSNASVCSGSFCQLCGSDGETCCPGQTCPGSTSSLQLYCSTSGTCAPCGSDGDPCCPGSTACTGSPGLPLYCTATNTCAPCGGIGEPCCTSGVQCTTGTCNGATCQ